MNLDLRTFPRDDVVMDGSGPADWLKPGTLIDSDHPDIVAWARRVVGDAGDPREKALRLYHAIRDDIRYDPYTTPLSPGAYKASATLAAGHGYCINKAGLMAATCRAVGVPARVGYADVRNHMTTRRMTEFMGTDVFYFHGYVDIGLDGRWIKATPAFNRQLTERFGLKPLEWDGRGDSIYHPHDMAGRRHMEYLAYRGVYADIPFDVIAECFRREYPKMHAAMSGGAIEGDFAAEGEAETNGGTRVSFAIVPRSSPFIVLLVALASFGPLSMSIYTPVMPIVGASIGATPDDVKLTLTTYMLGFAAGQVFFGPLSDRFGRRPVLLVGLLLFALTSAGCALAGSIGQLLVLRVLQGLSACAGSVISRALTRDIYEFSELPRVMSWISIGVNVAPALAPLIGGHLGEWFGWQATFWALSVFASALFVIVALGVDETNKHRSTSLNLLAFARGSGEMLRDRRFLGFALTMGFIFGINFGMAVGMPFILQNTLGFTPRTVGFLSVIGVAGFALGGFANNRLIGRVRPTTIVQVAPLFHITGLTIIAILSISGVLTWWSITVPFMVCSFGSGLVVPNSNAGAVGLYPRLAGTASSLVGLAQMGMGAVGTVAVAITTGLGGYDRALPLVGEWIGCTTKACAIPMPLILAQLPFAFAAFFAARLLRTPR